MCAAIDLIAGVRTLGIVAAIFALFYVIMLCFAKRADKNSSSAKGECCLGVSGCLVFVTLLIFVLVAVLVAVFVDWGDVRKESAAIYSQAKQDVAAREMSDFKIDDEETYRGELEAYLEIHTGELMPFDPYCDDLQRALEQDLPVLSAVRKWNERLDSWANEDWRTLSPEDAAKMHADAKSIHKDLGGVFRDDAVDRRMDALLAIAGRVDENGEPIHLALTKLLNRPEMAISHVVEAKDGKKYYMLAPPTTERGELVLRCVVNREMTSKQVRLSSQQVAEASDSVSPPSHVARRIQDRLANLHETSWESTFYGILSDLHADTTLDPILKAELMRRTLAVACQGSAPFERAFREHCEVIGTSEASPTANWLDPNDADSQEARRVAQAKLGQLPDLRSAALKAATELRELEAISLATRHEWVGIVIPKESGMGPEGRSLGEVTLKVRPNAEEKCENLFVIGLDSEGVPTGEIAIEYRSDKLLKSQRQGGDVLVGQPVYAKLETDQHEQDAE